MTMTNSRFSTAVLGLMLSFASSLPSCQQGCATPAVEVGDAGFYHLVKQDDGTWWFREPGGAEFVSIGINHIEPVLITSESNRDIFEKRYGDDLMGPRGFVNPLGTPAKAWMDDSVALVTSWGFNTIGLHNPVPQHRLPYVARFRPYAIDGWRGLERNYPDPFDGAVVEHVEKEAKKWCELNSGDEKILGIAFNDMPIFRISPDGNHEWVTRIKSLEGEAPAKKQWIELLKARHADAATAAQVYGVEDSLWSDLQKRTQWPGASKPWLAYQDTRAFLPLVVDRWYGVISGAVRKCDSHHLILGDKLEGSRDMPPWLDPLVGKHFDMAFIQWYEYADRQIPRLRELHDVTGEPVLLGDSTFSVPSESIPHPKGIHMTSREEVGNAYSSYLEHVLAQPWIVGWHLCGFIDGSPDLASRHPYFAIQPGLLAADGTPHQETLTRVMQANESAHKWHEGPSQAARAATGLGQITDARPDRCEAQKHGLFHLNRIDNNVYNIGGFMTPKINVPIKNIGWIVTDEGVVVIDPGTKPTAMIALELIRQTTTRPIRYIIYTHHHGTQIYGAEVVREPETQILAHEDLVLEFDMIEEFREYNARRNRIQFDLPQSGFESIPIYPDITFTDTHEFTLGDTRFELYHVEGEAADYTYVFLPDQKILWVADMLGPGMPMVASPMKRVRDELKWKQALQLIESLEPEVLINSVQAPMCSRIEIETRTGVHIEYLDYLHDAVVAEMNAGSSLEETLEHIELPDHMKANSMLTQGYGCNHFNIRGLFHRYSGWFDQNGTHLIQAPAKLKAELFIEDMGGEDEVLARARSLHEEGHSTVALEYLDLLLAAELNLQQAHMLKAEVLSALALVFGHNPIMRNMYESLAQAETEAASPPAALVQ